MGRFYTGDILRVEFEERVAAAMQLAFNERSVLSVCDPFAGDGRLVEWLDSALPGGQRIATAELWDIDTTDLRCDRAAPTGVTPVVVQQDSFLSTLDERLFDVVVTNPPWVLLKPDARHRVDSIVAAEETIALRKYDSVLSERFPHSQPKKKFAGWGTNLAQVGFELATRIVKPGGVVAIYLPASVMADHQSSALRKLFFESFSLDSLTYIPAELKAFGAADVASVLLVGRRIRTERQHFVLRRVETLAPGVDVASSSEIELSFTQDELRARGWSVPVSVLPRLVNLTLDLEKRGRPLSQLFRSERGKAWAGREIDETRISERITGATQGDPKFIKGRNVQRFGHAHTFGRVRVDRVPTTVGSEKIVWRDVSRASQQRRMVATIVPKGFVAGNSLGVIAFRESSGRHLRILLAIMNSLAFEAQLRLRLATSHVSLTALAEVSIPPLETWDKLDGVADFVDQLLRQPDVRLEAEVDALIARRGYGLEREEYAVLVEAILGRNSNETHLEMFDRVVLAEQEDAA